MEDFLKFVTPDNLAVLFAVMFGISEALAHIPAVKSNSIFQAVFGLLKTLAGKDTKGGES